jgi:membrane protein YdbS with pleckstrin-like domain
MWIYPTMFLTLGLYAFWRRLTYFVVTTQRVIHCGGIFNTYERSLPLRYVQDATVTRDWQGVAKVTITTAGGPAGTLVLHPLTPRAARELKDTVLRLARP